MKHEKVKTELDFFEDLMRSRISRREFLKVVGEGIFIFYTCGITTSFAQERTWSRRSGTPEDFNAYLRIAVDGKVTCFTGKVELGQGVIASLAQMLAEELDVSYESITMIMGDTDLCPWDRGTHGSMSIRFFGPPLRNAGAEARCVLLDLAAESLGVPRDRLVAKNGIIYDKNNEQAKVTYAKLAQGKRIEKVVNHKVELKKVSKFTVIGKPMKRPDALEKVTGKARYAGDVRLPGMMYACILRPPSHGATLKSVDTTAAEKIEGVQVVRDDDFIAVLHAFPDIAERARQLIRAQYEEKPIAVDNKTIYQHLLNNAPGGNSVAQGGDLVHGEKQSTAVFEQTYYNAYVAHAPIEPHTAVAQIEGNKITIWASTQAPFPLQSSVSSALGFPLENVRVITPYVGGGFGGKNYNQQGAEAARLAKLSGKPVHLMWSREEEFFYDPFRPAAIVKIKSGITESGKIVLWDYHVYFAGSRGAEHFYSIPNHNTMVYGSGWTAAKGTHPFSTGPWRAPANNTNTFARECQIDSMAGKAGIDPVEFRLKNLTDNKMANVLESAAKIFGWKSDKLPSGRGFGVSCGIDAGTYVATMAEVDVDNKTGHVQVKRIVCAQNMGLVINPEGTKHQMEGCITMGLGYALTEEIQFQGGQIFDRTFNTYKIPTFSMLPKIETILIDDNESPAQGGGEPPIINMGAVVANAIYDAIGVRLFHLPMTPERIKEALAKKRG